MTVTSHVSNLNLETLSEGNLPGDVLISGTVDGKVTLNAPAQKPWLATYDVTLANFRTTHPAAGSFSRQPVSGDITGSAIIGPGQIRFKDTSIRSAMFRAEVRGVCIPHKPISSSRLELTVNLQSTSTAAITGTGRPPKSARTDANLLKGPISFKIRGTLDNPSVRMTLPAD